MAFTASLTGTQQPHKPRERRVSKGARPGPGSYDVLKASAAMSSPSYTKPGVTIAQRHERRTGTAQLHNSDACCECMAAKQ